MGFTVKKILKNFEKFFMVWRVLSPIHLTTYRGGRILAARLLKSVLPETLLYPGHFYAQLYKN